MTEVNTPSTYWRWTRVVIWLGLTFIMIAITQSMWRDAFRSAKPDQLLDFAQEWLSAKNYAAGMQVYTHQADSIRAHLNVEANREILLPWNAHPPASILLALPFAAVDYPQAHFLWSLCMVPLFLFCVWLIGYQLDFGWKAWSILPVLTLCLSCHPLRTQFLQGQLNIVLLFLITITWALARNGYDSAAGFTLGLATALKLFPGFIFLYFLVRGRWLALITGALGFAGLNGVAYALFGKEAFETYIRVVIPSLQSFVIGWPNDSLPGFFTRTFDPRFTAVGNRANTPLFPSLILAQSLTYVAQAIVVLLCIWGIRKSAQDPMPDRAFAILSIGMLLVSPVAWPHYRVLLLVALSWLWMRINDERLQIFFGLALLILWIPKGIPLFFTMGPEPALEFLNWNTIQIPRPVAPIHHLVVFSLSTYVLCLLCLMALFVPARTAAPEPTEAPAAKRFSPASLPLPVQSASKAAAPIPPPAPPTTKPASKPSKELLSEEELIRRRLFGDD